MPGLKDALARALELDDTLGRAHSLAGQMRALRDWDWTAAEREHRRAIDLAPNDSSVRIWNAHFLSAMTRHEEAIEEAALAATLDPFSPLVLQLAGVAHRNARNFEKAIEYFDEALKWGPGSPWVQVDLGWTYCLKGSSKECREAFQEFRSQLAEITVGEQRQINIRIAEAWKDERLQLEGMMRMWLDEANDPASPLYMGAGPLMVAHTHALIGEREQALHWLEASFAIQNDTSNSVRTNLIFLKADPAWDSLRSEPRFQALLDQMGFPN